MSGIAEELGLRPIVPLTQAPLTQEEPTQEPLVDVSSELDITPGRDPGPAFEAASGVNPDKYAEQVGVSNRTGFPVTTVEQLPEMVEEDRRSELVRMLEDTPTTKDFFSDERNAKIASDDVKGLYAVELAMQARGGQGFRPIDAMSSGVDTVQSGPWTFMELVGEMTGNNELRDWGKAGREYNEQQIAARGPTQSITGADTAGEALVGVGELLANQIPVQASIFASAGAGAAVGALAGPVGAGIGALVGSLAAGISLMLGQAQSSLKKRDPDLEAPYAVLGLGIAGGLLERATFGAVSGKVQRAVGFNPADALAKSLVGKGTGHIAKRTSIETAKGMLREGSTEAAQDTLIEYGTAYLADQNVDWGEFGPQLLESFVGGLIMGGTMSGAVTPFTEHVKIKKAEAYRDNVVEVIDRTRESALRTRSPEVFQEYIQALAADTGRETVSVDAKPIVEYLLEQGVDPAAEFAAMGVDRKSLNEAYETGGDVNVGMPAFLARMTDSEHLDAVLVNMRENPQAATMAETNVRRENISGSIDAAVAEARTLLEGDSGNTREDMVERVTDAMYQQLKDTRIYSAEGSRNVATNFGAFANTVAEAYESEGKTFDMEGFFTDMGIRIEKGIFNQPRATDEVVNEDPLLQKNAPWEAEEVTTTDLTDGSTFTLPAGEARDILQRRQRDAQALLDCVSASS